MRDSFSKRIVAVGLCLAALLAVGRAATVASAQSGQSVLPAEELLRRWIESVWNGGKLELVPSLVNTSYVRHEAVGTRAVTPEQYALEISATRKRFPDLRFTQRDRIVQGDRVWVRWSFRGTDATTGRVIVRGGLQIYRIENGKLAETWVASLPDGADW